jgi:hypothetical protein
LGSGVLSPSSLGNIVSTNAFKHSSEWKLGDDVEWSVDVETEVFVQTLSSSLISFVKIKNIPFLAVSSVVVPDVNCITFFILL